MSQQATIPFEDPEEDKANRLAEDYLRELEELDEIDQYVSNKDSIRKGE